mmetsp:Transcript_17860/g.58713  ORF Transcript_17860/g.58713 Transcript_17860/m.58713 type:complete len:218 (-) Transcript_17860:571-1224(-)
MSANKVNRRSFNFRILQRKIDRLRNSFARWHPSQPELFVHLNSLRHSNSRDLTVHLCSTSLRVFLRLHQQHAAAFRKQKSLALLVECIVCMRLILIAALGERGELVVTRNDALSQAGLTSSCRHDRRLPRHEEPPRLSDRQGSSCRLSPVASDAVVGPLRPELNSSNAACAIEDEGGDDEGGDLLEPLVRQLAPVNKQRALVDAVPSCERPVPPRRA